MKKISPETKWIFRQLLFKEILSELDRDFSRLNIEYIPIKGAYLICTGLSEKIKERTMIDIDLLVKEDDFETVSAYFTQNKRTSMIPHKWQFETGFYYRFKEIEIPVEVHKMLNFKERFILPVEDIFKRGIRDNVMRVLPCPEDALLITICHILVHIAVSYPDKTFHEMALIIRQKGFSWDKFWETALKTGVSSFVYYALKLCEKEYPGEIQLRGRHTYADILVKLVNRLIYSILPVVVRRMIFEIPFVSNPTGLVIQKLKVMKCTSLFRFYVFLTL